MGAQPNLSLRRFIASKGLVRNAVRGATLILALTLVIPAFPFAAQLTTEDQVAIGAEGQDLSERDLRPFIDQNSIFMHRIPALQNRPGYKPTGSGVTVGIWDGGPVLNTHEAFGSRVDLMENDFHFNNHATHVAGTIAGAPLLGVKEAADAIGVAERARVASYAFCNTENVPQSVGTAVAQHPTMRITNHSWGVPLGSANYEKLQRGFDAAIKHNPAIIAIVAAGNDRPFDVNSTGQRTYKLPPAYGNLRSPGIARNVITVGAMVDLQAGDDLSTVGRGKIVPTYFSSLGPTPDGRIKPDVIANGWDLIAPSTFHDDQYPAYQRECWAKTVNVTINSCQSVSSNNRQECLQRMSGTSMAAPVTSGVGALLQELAFAKRGNWLLADELKAILVHTAVTKDNRPTYLTGWGAYRADLAGDVIDDWQTKFEPSRTGQVFTRLMISDKPLTFRVTRLAGEPVRLTLVWLDEPSKSLTGGLSIDLDMSLTPSKGGTASYLPWTLDPSHPGARAVRARNSRDNVERIDVSTLESMGGEWILKVRRNKSTGAPVPFALISLGLKLVR